MRKIALISDHASPLAQAGGNDAGGQNIYVAAIARELARQGCAVDVFTRRDNALQPEQIAWLPGVRVIHVPAGPARHVPKEELLPWMGAFGEFLLAFCRREAQPYDVLHANFFMSGQAALPVARALDVPLVMTFHALGRVRRRHLGSADTFPDARFAIEDELVACADRIIAECPQDRADLLALYGADPARIAVVPCGFDPAELAPLDQVAARARLGWPQRRFTVLQLGRLVPRKGIDSVIRALPGLRAQHGVTARLVVVGGNTPVPDARTTPEIGRLRAVAHACGVTGQVVFAGRRPRSALATLYSAADVFVTMPWYEPFGITAVEAMACAVPVVAAAVGGLATTVVDGRTGYLVAPDAPDAAAVLAARLACLAATPALRATLGEAARQRAQRCYTWAQIGRQLMAVYCDVAAERAGPAVRGAPATASPPAALLAGSVPARAAAQLGGAAGLRAVN